MVEAPPRSDFNLFCPFQIAGPVLFGPAVGAAVASDPLDVAGRGPSFGADRHAATPAETVGPLAEAVADRDPLVEDETLTLPKAFGLRRRFEIAQDAAFQMEDVLNALGLEEGGGLFTADSAGAVHGDLRRVRPVQQGAALGAEPVGEVAKSTGIGLDRPFEGPDGGLIVVAGVDHHDARLPDQGVPVSGRDIGSGIGGRVEVRLAHGDDLGLDPDLQPVERHGVGVCEFDVEVSETGQGADARQHAVDGRLGAGDGAVQPLTGDQQGAAHIRAAQGVEAIAHGGAVSDGREPVEGGDADGGGWRGKVHQRCFRANASPEPDLR